MNKLKLFTISAFLLTPIVLITCNDQDPQQTAPTTTITTITPEKALAKIKEVSLKIKNEQGEMGNVTSLNLLMLKIPENSKEYSEAQAILKEIEPITKKIVATYEKEQKAKNEAQAKIEEKLAEENRVKFAQRAEYSFLDNRLNITVTTSGKKQTTIKLRYALMSKVFIHQVLKSEFTKNAKQAGFKKIIFTDGYDDTWTLDIDKT